MERETAVARKQVEDAKTAIKQEQEDMKSAECGGLTSREPGHTFEEMLDAIGGSLSDLASSNDEVDGKDDQHTEQGKLNEDAEPGWVMGTITKTVQQRMERFRQKQITLEELTQPGGWDAADYFCEQDMKDSTTELKVPAVIKLHTDHDAANPAPTTYGENLDYLDIIPGISQMPQGTSRPGSSHMRLGSGRLQSNKRIASLPSNVEPDSSPIMKANPIQPISLYPCILPSN